MMDEEFNTEINADRINNSIILMIGLWVTPIMLLTIVQRIIGSWGLYKYEELKNYLYLTIPIIDIIYAIAALVYSHVTLKRVSQIKKSILIKCIAMGYIFILLHMLYFLGMILHIKFET